jgi:hypothetical protein
MLMYICAQRGEDMTVAELQAKLDEHPGDTVVYVADSYRGGLCAPRIRPMLLADGTAEVLVLEAD